MCYRYQLAMSPKLEPIAEAAKRSKLYYNNIGRLGKPVLTEGEIFPNSIVPVLAPSKNGKKTAYPMWWGYTVQGIGKPLVNARSETAAEKEIFRESWVGHRCAVPASWYFEWEHFKSPSGRMKTGDKYAIMPKDTELMYFCGLYRIENNYPHFVILTQPACESIAFIHDRQPVIMTEDAVDCWIDPKFNPYVVLKESVLDLMAEKEI
ncbi:MAG: SOS response-associated peptidase [Oscillospiraceae bacterium]|nr:SOS response-associated peptidase [Oscillospiraceae bacterium]